MRTPRAENRADPAEDLGGLLVKEHLPAGRQDLAEPIVAHSARERILNSIVRCCARNGYGATTIADVVAEAGISRATFYELFKGKDDCLHAAMELAIADMMGEVAAVYSPDKPWVSNVRDATEAILALLARRPDWAKMSLIEAPASGTSAVELYASGKRVLQTLIDRGRDGPLAEERIPSSASRAALAAAESLVTGQILAGNAERLPELLPDIVYITTIPYLGREGALKQFEAAERSVRSRVA